MAGQNHYWGRPISRLQIYVLTDVVRLVLAPVLVEYIATYPQVRLEIAVKDDFVDIVGSGFDAGIRFGGKIPEDMIAVPLGNDPRWPMVASPAYLASAPPLRQPSALSVQRCIGMRTGTGALYRWELERGEDAFLVDVEWAIIVSEAALANELAEGGIAYCQEGRVAGQINEGMLVEVLPGWSSIGPAFHRYYPAAANCRKHRVRSLD